LDSYGDRRGDHDFWMVKENRKKVYKYKTIDTYLKYPIHEYNFIFYLETI
jgi:hypothetical protein